MKTVWKFPITALDDFVTLSMPDGAMLLDVQMQRGVMTVWALVDPNVPSRTRTFRIAGTGHPITDEHQQQYFGTVQDGDFVWHVFEVTS